MGWLVWTRREQTKSRACVSGEPSNKLSVACGTIAATAANKEKPASIAPNRKWRLEIMAERQLPVLCSGVASF